MYRFVLSFVALCLLGSLNSFGQAGRGAGMTFTVYGKILDQNTQEPMAFSAVSVFDVRNDSLVTGTMVESNGDFRIEKLPMGQYRIEVIFMGYETLSLPLKLTPGKFLVDLGNLQMNAATQKLQDVEVVAERAAITMGVDRKIFNIDKDLSTAGGTALDAMRNVPLVNVDADGGVTVRNATPMIFIDGRPTQLTLEQIPAEEIDRIEVITNPSARFDASATGGILNIIMKKNLKPGYNGMATAGAGTNYRYNGMLSLNTRVNKWSVNASYSANASQPPTTGFTERTNLEGGKPISSFRIENENLADRLFQFGRLGVEYRANNRNTFALNQSMMGGRFNNVDNQQFEIFGQQQNLTGQGTQNNVQNAGFSNYSAQFLHTYAAAKEGKEWISDVTYNRSQRQGSSEFAINNLDANGNQLPNNPEIQDNQGFGYTDMVSFQTDYTDPLTDNLKLELGAKSYWNFTRNVLEVSFFDYGEGALIRDDLLSNDFVTREAINAVYANLVWKTENWNYQAGIRYEQSNFAGQLADKEDETFGYDYPSSLSDFYNALFPSFFASRKLGRFNEIQFNLSRKLNRPNWWQIMPFIMFSDRQNFRIGNPGLAPEFINIGEVNHNYIFSSGSFLNTLFVRHTQNVITPYLYPSPSDSTVLINTFINGNDQYDVGYEMNFRRKVTEKFEFNVNGNAQYTVISASTEDELLNNRGFTGFAKLMMQYNFGKGWLFQVNGSYQAPQIVAQGRLLPVYFADASLRKDWGKNLSLLVQVNDVFNTRVWGGIYETPMFEQTFQRRRDIRHLRVTLTWRFGETDPSIFRRFRRAGNSGGGQDMEGGF